MSIILLLSCALKNSSYSHTQAKHQTKSYSLTWANIHWYVWERFHSINRWSQIFHSIHRWLHDLGSSMPHVPKVRCESNLSWFQESGCVTNQSMHSNCSKWLRRKILLKHLLDHFSFREVWHGLTASYSSYQNCVAELMSCTLLSLTRSMPQHKGLRVTVCAGSLVTTNHVNNSETTHAFLRSKTHYHVWKGHAPTIGMSVSLHQSDATKYWKKLY